MSVEYVGMTDKGLKRATNQDAIVMLCENGMGLFVVADGMGGHENGELASAAIIEFVQNWWNENLSMMPKIPFMDIVADIQHCLERANQKIYQSYNQNSVCGSTLVLLFIYQDKYAVISAGDSRVYSLYKRKLSQMTTDEIWDNLPQTILHFTERKIKEHPSSGKLINAFGAKEKLSLSIKTEMLSSNRLFLLCSDGVTKECSEKQLRKILLLHDKGEKLINIMERIKGEVYKNGAADNLSIILVLVEMGGV